jgi:plastocyanin
MEDLIVSFHAASRAWMRLAPNVSLLLLAGALAAGCGSSSKSSTATTSSASTAAPAPAATAPAGGSSILNAAANPEGLLKFDQSSLTAKAGSVSISFTNSSSVPHNLTVGSASGALLGATPTFQGGTKILPLHLAAGTYKFYCTVPGHRAAGMEGTLTVH